MSSQVEDLKRQKCTTCHNFAFEGSIYFFLNYVFLQKSTQKSNHIKPGTFKTPQTPHPSNFGIFKCSLKLILFYQNEQMLTDPYSYKSVYLVFQ